MSDKVIRGRREMALITCSRADNVVTERFEPPYRAPLYLGQITGDV